MPPHRQPHDLHVANYEVVDPGDGAVIQVDRWNMHVPLVIGSGAETNTLPNPTKAGSRLSLAAVSVGGGTRTVTAASPISVLGGTEMVFTTAGDFAVLESVRVSGGYAWRLVFARGVANAMTDPLEVDDLVVNNSVDLPAESVEREDLETDEAAYYDIPLTQWGPTGAPGLLGASAGTPSGAFGLTIGTHGTATPKIVGEAANNNSKTNLCRILYPLPVEYVAGEPVKLRVSARITGNVQVAQTIDAKVFIADGAAGVDAAGDIVTTNAIALTTSFGNKDFTLDPTLLGPGVLLDIELTGLADDTGGSANKLIEIGRTGFLLDVKG